jgi:penicillin G amidase
MRTTFDYPYVPVSTAEPKAPAGHHLQLEAMPWEEARADDPQPSSAPPPEPRCAPSCCWVACAAPFLFFSFIAGALCVSYIAVTTSALSAWCSWWIPAIAIMGICVIVGPAVGMLALALPAIAARRSRSVRGACCTSSALCVIAVVIAVATVVVLAAVAGALVYLTTGNGIPSSVPGFLEPVRIEYDTDGVPHIYANNEHDAFMAVGLAQAKDRLWQMEFQRRAGRGTLSELVGPGALESDKLSRILGLEEAAHRAYDAVDDRTRAALLAYSEGVNAYLSAGPTLPLEFLVFMTTPAQWSPIDSLVWEEMINFQLSCNLDAEIVRWKFVTEQGLSYARVSQLYPSYNRTEHITVLSLDELAGPTGVVKPASEVDDDDIVRFVDAHRGVGVAGGLRGYQDWSFVVPPYDFLPLRRGPSNNYAISGRLTSTGAPILADDPHLLLTMPGIWYGMHVEIEGSAKAIGVGFVGMPAVVIGRTDRIAWGVTTAAIDVEDLYLLSVVHGDDGSVGYQYDGEVLPFVRREEVINVAGEAAYTLTVLHTQDGMPVIGDPLLREDDPCALALRWASVDPAVSDTTAESFTRLMFAHDWDSFVDALSLFIGPIHNFVFASVDGDIGYIAPGRVPQRAPGVTGVWPVPGNTSKYAWRPDPVPYDALPRSKNPAKGYVASANNMITPSGYEAPGWVLAGEYLPGYRAQRIADLIDAYVASGRLITPRDAQTIQLDVMSYQFHSVAGVLRELPRELLSDLAAEWRDKLVAWDGDSVVGSTEATVFNAWVLELQRMDQAETGLAQWGQWATAWYHVVAALRGAEADPGCLGSCAAFAARALNTAVLRYTPGIRWGSDIHPALFKNHIMSNTTDIVACAYTREVQHGGDCHTLNAGCPADTDRMEMVSGPSYRQVVDLADMDASAYLVPPGQAGEPLSAHYDDQLGRFEAGEYATMRMAGYDVDYAIAFPASR